MKKLVFSNGDAIPMCGLGTWKSEPGEVYQAVLWAIEAGYRHIDCAPLYLNEKEVGQALTKAFSDGLVKREEIFITSKLWNDRHRLSDVKDGLEQTLQDLQLAYLDLYLVHWPISVKLGIGIAKTREEFYSYEEVPLAETWQGMQQVQSAGLARHIGVSNFNIAKLEELFAVGGQGPEMNQVELHPYLRQDKLVKHCHAKGMHMTAYSPLGSGDRPALFHKEQEPSLFEDPLVKELSEKYAVSPAQILIAFHINRNIAVVPKSVNRDRIAQNLQAAELQLEPADMDQLLSMPKQYRFIDGTFFTGPESPYGLDDLWEGTVGMEHV